MSRAEEIKRELYDETVAGHHKQVKTLTEEAVALGMPPLEILFGALIPALQEVGRRFEIGDYFVPEMLLSAKGMQNALVILRPLLAETGAKPVGKVVMLTVKGDVHDIGKNLCDIMLEGAGFEVIDIGVNTPPDKIVEAVRTHSPQLLGFSAFLTTTMPMIRVNLERLAQEGLRDKVRVMAGGAPVTAEYAKKMGADAYAPDASSTVREAKRLMKELGYDLGEAEAPAALTRAVAETEAVLGKAREESPETES